MQDKITYDELYKKVLASLVVWEKEMFWQEKHLEITGNRRCTLPVTPAMVVFCEQYFSHNLSRFPGQIYNFNYLTQTKRHPSHKTRLQTSHNEKNMFPLRMHRPLERCASNSSISVNEFSCQISNQRIRDPPDQAAARILLKLVEEEDFGPSI